MPTDEDPTEIGRIVEYPQPEGKLGNHPKHVGYISWSPKFAFDAAYRPTKGLTFGEAIEGLKKGNRVCREGWNGNRMYAFLIKSGEWTFTNGVNDNFPCREMMGLKTAQEDIAAWAPSGSDALAEQWIILD